MAAGPRHNWGSRCLTEVPVMQAADHGPFGNRSQVGWLDSSGHRTVLAQPQVSPCLMVVAKVQSEDSPQVYLVEHDHLVQAVSTYGGLAVGNPRPLRIVISSALRMIPEDERG